MPILITQVRYLSKMYRGFLLAFIILASVTIVHSTENVNKDSIISTILNADKVDTYMHSIKTDVGSEVLALNEWANNAAWNHPDEVKEIAEEIIRYAIEVNNDSLLSWSYHYLGLAYLYMNYWNLSISTYQKALSTKWAVNSVDASSFRAFCELNMGVNYEYLGKFDQALSHYYTSITMNEELEVPFVVAEAKLEVASLNIRMGNTVEARKNTIESLDVLYKFNDSVRISEGYRILCIVETMEDHFEQAENYFEQAETIALQLNDDERLVKIYLAYGDALYKQEHWQEALHSYKKALGYCTPSKFPASYYQVNSGIGKVQMALKQFNKAANNLLIASEGLSRINATVLLLEVNQNLAKLYAQNGDTKQFQHFFALSLAQKDSLAAKEKLRNIAEMEIIYQSDQKDRQIKFQNYQLNTRKKQVLLISLIAILLFLGFLIVLKLLQNVSKKNKNLLERNLELSQRWEQVQESYFTNKPSNNDILFKKIYQIIVDEQEFKNPKLSVDYLARKLNSNTKYVSQTIKDSTAMNFNSFINTFRIEKAKSILRSDEAHKWSLEVIADKCGFNNHATFYQQFKQNTGLTPSIFRKISS